MCATIKPTSSTAIPAGFQEIGSEEARIRFGQEWQNPQIAWCTRGLAWSWSLSALRGYAADERKAGRDPGIFQERRPSPLLGMRRMVCGGGNPDVRAFEPVPPNRKGAL